MRSLRLILSTAVLCSAATTARAELPDPALPVEQVVDQLIDARIAEAAAEPAPLADDATLVRRLTLDLVGRVPTAGEVAAFVASTDPRKKIALVDRLMASPGFARHQGAMFETMLNPDVAMRNNGALRDYLTAAVQDNKAWDKIFRELMLPDETDAKVKGAADFLRGRLTDADKLTNDVSVGFFGVNVSCAQCHDHPLVKDWTQEHFYGMKSFLVRTYDAGGFVAERSTGVVKYKPTKGPERTARMMFLTGAVITDSTAREMTSDEAKKEKEAIEKAKAAKKAPPKPTFSARARLVDVSLEARNADFFARSIANRMWHRFFGAGLVNPLDQMHSENPASHPELLAWLARDTATHQYDLRRLIRGLVLSKSYARSSRYPSAATPDGKLFAVARLRPLTPMQLAVSLKIAVADPASLDSLKPAEFEKKIEQLEGSVRGFSTLIAQPTDNFQIGVGEALLFSNSDKVNKEMIADGGGSLLGRIKPGSDATENAKLLVQNVYGRAATAEELTAIVAYITKRSGRAADAYRQVLWALVASPEFRFNY